MLNITSFLRDLLNKPTIEDFKKFNNNQYKEESSIMSGNKPLPEHPVSAVDLIAKEEGFRKEVYLCSEGYATIGYGTLISTDKDIDIDRIVISMNEGIALKYLIEEVLEVRGELATGRYSHVFMELPADKQDILISMGYQLGIGGLYKFKKMWAALANRNYPLAEAQALDSRWAKQTPRRASHHASVLGGTHN
ncbi:MAG: hypothetical protein KAG37_05120 [Flavobacteriales bacterium]|nr:hypothetical protein [Flavobacteriales bacterium]